MLFKGTVWPTFILGAQTRDSDRREWVVRRLEQMWLTICPWGYVKTALETLEALWRFRDGEQTAPSSPESKAPLSVKKQMRCGWLSELRALKIDCLIV
jgi:hypothetical protein